MTEFEASRARLREMAMTAWVSARRPGDPA